MGPPPPPHPTSHLRPALLLQHVVQGACPFPVLQPVCRCWVSPPHLPTAGSCFHAPPAPFCVTFSPSTRPGTAQQEAIVGLMLPGRGVLGWCWQQGQDGALALPQVDRQGWGRGGDAYPPPLLTFAQGLGKQLLSTTHLLHPMPPGCDLLWGGVSCLLRRPGGCCGQGPRALPPTSTPAVRSPPASAEASSRTGQQEGFTRDLPGAWHGGGIAVQLALGRAHTELSLSKCCWGLSLGAHCRYQRRRAVPSALIPSGRRVKGGGRGGGAGVPGQRAMRLCKGLLRQPRGPGRGRRGVEVRAGASVFTRTFRSLLTSTPAPARPPLPAGAAPPTLLAPARAAC